MAGSSRSPAAHRPRRSARRSSASTPTRSSPVIIVQMPLPKRIPLSTVIDTLDPAKDIDGLHPRNAGLLTLGYEGFLPTTAHAAVELLKRSGIEIAGKRVVVVGRSNVVGKPAALLLMREHATVTICHSKTTDLARHLKEAEIVVVAAGKPGLVTGEDAAQGRRRRGRGHQRRRRQARRRRGLRVREQGRLRDHAGPGRRRPASPTPSSSPTSCAQPRTRRKPSPAAGTGPCSPSGVDYEPRVLPLRPRDRPRRDAPPDHRGGRRPRLRRRRGGALRPHEGQGHDRGHPPPRGARGRAASTSW